MATIMLFVLALSLYADRSAYNDTIKFQIDFVINNNARSTLTVTAIDDTDTTVDQIQQAGEYDRKVFTQDANNSLTSQAKYKICSLQLDTNIIGRNNIVVEATPLYSVYPDDRKTSMPSVGYTLFFYKYIPTQEADDEDNAVPAHNELYCTTEIGIRKETTYLACDVPIVFTDDHLSFLYYVDAQFTNLADMAGRYTSTLTIGVEGQ